MNGDFDKLDLISGYKFCVAMENSITKDYITEKLWQVRQQAPGTLFAGSHWAPLGR